MRSKCIPSLVIAAFLVAAALPLSAQSNPAAVQGAWPIIAGGGLSWFNFDYHNVPSSYMEGPTIWADWVRIPFVPQQFGVHAEFRKLDLGAPSAAPQLRSSAFLGGPTYTWTVDRLGIYGKGLIGYGSLHFPPFGSYSYDTRTIYGFGGGAEYRCWNSIWARADYEYQYWPNLLVPGGMKPRGLTFSLGYDFRTIHRRF